mgnify:CR=1 FL=1
MTGQHLFGGLGRRFEGPEHVVGGIDDGEQFGHRRMGETTVDDLLDQVPQRRPVTQRVDHDDGLGMDAELLPGDDLQRLVERPQPAGQDHETVGQLEHAVLALVHGGGDNLFCHFVVADLQVLEEFGDDADGLAAAAEHRVGQHSHQADTPAADATLDAPASSNDLGAELTSLDDDIRRRYGIPKDVDGVVVTTVSARGRSFGKLQRGDVLVEVNFERVTTVTDTISKVEAAMTTPRQPLLLRVKRRGEAGWFDQFISVDLTNS